MIKSSAVAFAASQAVDPTEPVRIRHASLLLLAALGPALLPVAAASSEAAAHAAQFDHALGTAASGTVSGRCTSTAALFPLRAGGFDFTSATATLERYLTEWNTTVLLPASNNPTIIPSAPRQVRFEDVRLASGAGHVAWSDHGRVRAFSAGWPAMAEGARLQPFEASFRSEGVVTGPLTNSVEAGQFFVEQDGSVTVYEPGGWNRLLDARRGTLELARDLTLYLEGATVHDGGTAVYEQSEAHETTVMQETPAMSVYRHRHHHALLRLAQAHIAVAAEDARIACRALEADVVGTWAAHSATGLVSVDGQQLPFRRADLSLVGRFALTEDLTTQDPPTIHGSATGSFTIVGLDYADTRLARGPPAALVVAGGALALAAIASVVGWRLYTRLEKPALLDLETRTLVLETVRANPWSSVAELERVTGRSRSTIRYQLGVLQRHGLVRVDRTHGHPRFAVQGDADAPPAPIDPVVRTIQQHLDAGPRRLSDIMRALMAEHEYSRFGAWKAIRRATSQGSVSVERNDEGVWVRCS